MPSTPTTRARLRKRNFSENTRRKKSPVKEMATTIDVVPLHSEEAAPEPRDNSTNRENNEKAAQVRKRGRPTGAKDNKRRKTPVRRKKATDLSPIVQEEAPQQSLPPAASSTPQIKEPSVAPAIQPIITRPTPEVSEMTPFQRSRLQYLQRQSAQQAHWDGIVTPMFRYPIY